MAANFVNNKVLAADKGLVIICGRITSTDGVGEGFSYANAGTGLYTITLNKQYVGLVAALATFSAATPANVAGHTAVFDDYTAVSSGDTIQVTVYNASDAAHDLAASEELNFCLVLQNTNV